MVGGRLQLYRDSNSLLDFPTRWMLRYGQVPPEICGEAKRLLDNYVVKLNAFHEAQMPSFARIRKNGDRINLSLNQSVSCKNCVEMELTDVQRSVAGGTVEPATLPGAS
jgi:hypothetical protein